MLNFATAIVRAWTWLYTAGLDPDLRDDRRAQIESDVWDFKDDGAEQGVHAYAMAVHMLARVLLGLPDDLLWRTEQMTVRAAAAVVTFGPAPSQPVTFRRVSGFGASATVHALLVMLTVWFAPQFTSVALHGNSSVRTTAVVYVPPDALTPPPPALSPGDAPVDVIPEDTLGLSPGDHGSTVAMPGFTFDFSKVIARAGTLFPFVTGTPALERIAAAAMLPQPPRRLVNPFGRVDGDSGGLPALSLSSADLQKLVDRSWARRNRWNAFTALVPTVVEHSANDGALPELMRAYVEQNGLQPYVESSIRDPRLWTQLGVVADHADFVDFISRYLGKHPASKTSTELLFLLDTLVQGSYDTLTALLDVIPEEDLHWTRSSNRAAYETILTIQQHYRAELEHRSLTTRASLRLYFDAARVSILTNLIETTPGGYRANDARFLIGGVYWKQRRVSEAIAAWSGLEVVQTDRYANASAAILDTLRAKNGAAVDTVRIGRILDAERGRWVSFSHDRLKLFGYRFDVF